MNSLLILVPITLVLFGLAIWAFAWAVRRGQFDDLETPAIDILAEEHPSERQASESASPTRKPHAN